MPKNNNLLKLQQQFADHIFDRREVSVINSLSYSRQEALARLNIYRNNVFGNFSAVLSSIFEITKKILGEEKFAKLVEKYAVKHASESGNLDDYGNLFPQFLKKIKPEFLAGLARLELFFHQTYFAADAKNFDVEKFKKISPEKFQNLQFELHPSCFLFAAKFAVFSIWKNPSKKKSFVKKPQFMLIERALNKAEIHEISKEEFIFLNSLNQKENLYKTYKKICRITKKDCDIGKILSKFIELGVITKFKIQETK